MPELEFAARAVRRLVLVDVTRVCNQPSAWSWSERCGDLDIGREFQPAPNRPCCGTASRTSIATSSVTCPTPSRRHRAPVQGDPCLKKID